MSRGNFFWKIVLLATGVATLFGLFTMWLAYVDIRSAWVDATDRHLKSLCLAVEGQILPFIAVNREAEADRLAKALGRELSARLTVIRPDGRVVADTAGDPATMGNHADRAEVAAALSLGAGSAVRHSLTLREDRVYVALRSPHKGPLQAVIRASLSLEEANRLSNRLFWKIALSAGGVLFCAFLAALLLSRGIARPIRRLTEAAGRLAGGDFSSRVLTPGPGELAPLAAAFNFMAERVEGLFHEVSQRQEQLEMVVSSIQDALAVIGRDNLVLRANQAFRQQFGRAGAAVEGKPYTDAVPAAEFAEALRRCRESEGTVTCDMVQAGRTYLCSLSPLRFEKSVAVLLFDITERKRVDNLQKELIVNFSHEFKTPLTAVRGFAESIEDEAPDSQTREHAAIIRRNAERLQRITEDLLMLARLDRKDMPFRPEPVDLAGAVGSVAALFARAMEGKGLAFVLDVAPDFPPLLADPFLLEQVLVNLFDNAVRHTAAGRLTVTGLRQGNTAVVRFADTGEGISPEHLGRIFDRFYVVDASRSRRRDGTGLGLAIVRSIVLRHGGEISVESRPGEGTAFSLVFPLAPGPI